MRYVNAGAYGKHPSNSENSAITEIKVDLSADIHHGGGYDREKRHWLGLKYLTDDVTREVFRCQAGCRTFEELAKLGAEIGEDRRYNCVSCKACVQTSKGRKKIKLKKRTVNLLSGKKKSIKKNGTE